MGQSKVYIASMPGGLKQCDWTEDAAKLVKERFRRRNQEGEIIESTEEMCWRIAYHIASADKKYGKTDEEIMMLAVEFYNLLAYRNFFPNAPTMYNAGTGNGLQFSACFVLPIEDSMEGIANAKKWQMLIHKSGGGTGFAFSSLRQRNAVVKSTGGKSSGPISFLIDFNATTEAVKQGGMRRGANMAIMNVHHPDIYEFITCKGELSENNRKIYERLEPYFFSREALEMLKVSLLETQMFNFNISVAATDAFMKAVKENTDYDLLDPRDNSVVKRISARSVFDLIVEMAWKTGDPGLWFIDRTNDSPANPIPALKTIYATNPCGEQPLFDFDVCNLGSINLANFVIKESDGKYQIHWEELEKTVRSATRFLDNVIELNPYPLPQIMELAHQIRRIGLGVMGWADMLTYLGISYASEKACNLAEKIEKFINQTGHDESEKLAEERGPFPLWDKSIYKDGKPIRNCTVTTIAPTGEIRILAGCSGGIEPLYGLTEVHKFQDRTLYRIQPAFHRLIEVLKEKGLYNPALEEEIKNRGYIGDLDNIPAEIKKVFAIAREIRPDWHVKMQAAFQRYTDNGVSKTINLPNSATKADVEKAYWMAYDTGCRGITVFRDGCKGQVLSVGIGESKTKAESKNHVRSRPAKLLPAVVNRVETPDGAAYVIIGSDPKLGYDAPFELFVTVAKAGTDAAADAEAIGRLASGILRIESPMPLLDRLIMLKEQLKNIGGSRISGFGKDKTTSLADGVSKAIDEYINYFGFIDKNSSSTGAELSPIRGNRCPECQQAALVYEEGCSHCSNCDFSVC